MGDSLGPPPVLREDARRGRVRVVRVPDPAVGAEAVITIPSSWAWDVLAVRLLLTSSATVTTRIVKLIVDDGTDEVIRINPGISHAQSVAAVYSFIGGLGYALAGATLGGSTIGMGPLLLPAGWRIQTSTGNLQVGDQYSGIVLYGVEHSGPSTEG